MSGRYYPSIVEQVVVLVGLIVFAGSLLFMLGAGLASMVYGYSQKMMAPVLWTPTLVGLLGFLTSYFIMIRVELRQARWMQHWNVVDTVSHE